MATSPESVSGGFREISSGDSENPCGMDDTQGLLEVLDLEFSFRSAIEIKLKSHLAILVLGGCPRTLTIS